MCGDPFQAVPRDHEPPSGRYATGTIVREYRKGATIPVTIELTANHRGWMEFRLCPNNNVKVAVTQDCLDRHLLAFSSGGFRYLVSPDDHLIHLNVQLPTDVTCSQCLLQWKYNAGT